MEASGCGTRTPVSLRVSAHTSVCVCAEEAHMCVSVLISACVCLESRHNLHALSPGKAEQAFLSPWTARRWKTDL